MDGIFIVYIIIYGMEWIMIPKRKIPKDLTTLMDIILHDRKAYSIDDYVAAIIIATLNLNGGNRSQTSRQLKIPIKTLRFKLKMIEGLGYEVPESAWGRRKNIE
jgi:hypothetical protein